MKRYWFIYAEVAARPFGRINCGKYCSRKAAYNDLDRVRKAYPAYGNFRIESHQVPDYEPLYKF